MLSFNISSSQEENLKCLLLESLVKSLAIRRSGYDKVKKKKKKKIQTVTRDCVCLI